MTFILKSCRLLEFPKICDPRGDLEIIEDFYLPFSIKRAYTLSNVPEAGQRGGHAHKNLHQLIHPAAGSFNFILDDGVNRREVLLEKGGPSLYICPMIWREITDFSSDAVCLVLASENYDEKDYYRDYELFVADVNV